MSVRGNKQFNELAWLLSILIHLATLYGINHFISQEMNVTEEIHQSENPTVKS